MTEVLLDAGDGGPPRQGRGKGIGVMTGLLVLVLLVGIAVAGGRVLVGVLRPATPDFEGAGVGEVAVQVVSGDSAADIGRTLVERGVVKSVRAFTKAAQEDDRATRIQPGWYRMRREMKASLALAVFFDPKARIRSRYTVPEGATVATALEIIAKNVDGVSLASLKEAAANPNALGLPAWAKGRLEGFLFPATYDVEPGSSAVEVLTAMVDRFLVMAAETQIEDRAAAMGRTPYEVLTVASLIEAETPKDEERGKVATVAYNRLRIGMPLGFDSTTQYALGKRKQQLTSADFAVDGPYNTRKRKGLPPTPIGNPGEAAVLAALEPEPGGWLYFVCIDTEGNSAFSESYEQFLRDKRRSTCPGVG